MNIITLHHARENNLTFYFTGKPCKNGHTTYRYMKDQKCIECKKKWRKNSYGDSAEYKLKYYLANKEHLDQKHKESRLNNKDYISKNRIRALEWQRNNMGKVLARQAIRRCKKRTAIPKWYEKEKIEKLYIESKYLSEQHNISYDVDHIIPLQHPLVCGLHCFDNLRIITAIENRSKGNKFII